MQDQAERDEMLAWACARGLLSDVAALVSRGAAVNGRDRRGRAPAHYAAARAHAPVLEYLAGRGADLEAEDSRGRTPAHYAALSDVAVDAALRTAAERGREAAAAAAGGAAAGGTGAAAAAAEAAASAAADAGGPDLLDDRTATQRAQAAALGARGSGAEAVALLARRAPAWLLDAADGADDSPLHLACRHGAADATRALLAAGCRGQPGANKRGLTPLGEALAGGHLGCAAALVAAGADVSARMGDPARGGAGGKGKGGGGGGGGTGGGGNSRGPTAGLTLLHLAAASGQPDSVQYLLDCLGASPLLLEDAANAGGATPLHAAAAAGSAACAQLLLRAGADWRAEAEGGLRAADMVPDGPRAEALREALRTGDAALLEPRGRGAAAAAAAGGGGASGPATAGGGGGAGAKRGLGGWIGGLLSSAAGGGGVKLAPAAAAKEAVTADPMAAEAEGGGGGSGAVAPADDKAAAAAKTAPAPAASDGTNPPAPSSAPSPPPPRAPAAARAAATAAASPKTLPEQVAALPTEAERARRVEALARGTPDGALDALAAAGELTEAQAEALRALRRVGHVLVASRLVRMLRRDGAFQDDAADPAARPALETVRRAVSRAQAAGARAAQLAPGPERAAALELARAASAAARLAEDRLLRGEGAHPAAAAVSLRLRGLHARLREEAGGLRVTLEDLLVAPPAALAKPGSAEAAELRARALRDADERVAEFEKAVEAAKGRAVAAMAVGAGGRGGEKKAEEAANKAKATGAAAAAAAAAAAPPRPPPAPGKEREQQQPPPPSVVIEELGDEAPPARHPLADAAAALVRSPSPDKGGDNDQLQQDEKRRPRKAPSPKEDEAAAAAAAADAASPPWREQLWASFRESSLRAVKAVAMTALMVLLLWATGFLPGQTGGWVEALRGRLLLAAQAQQQQAAAAAAAAAAILGAEQAGVEAAAAAAAALPQAGHDEF